MRSGPILALLAFLGCSCSTSVQHHEQEKRSVRFHQLSTAMIASGLLEMEDVGSFQCRIDGEAVDAAEARRRIDALSPEETLRLSMQRDGSLVDLVVTGDDSVTVSTRTRWHAAIRSR